jgi:hypothetical protein
MVSVDSPFFQKSHLKNIDIPDFSKRNRYDSSSRHVRGKLLDLLGSHNSDGRGKILNALDFPMPWMKNFPVSYATDVAAFNTTVDMPMCNRNILYPASSMHWGLAATEGAHHLWHIDCDGFGTVIHVMVGLKLWIVGRPLPGFDLSNISQYLQNWDVNALNDTKLEMEAILLAPGSTL